MSDNGKKLIDDVLDGSMSPLPDGMAGTFYPEKLGPRPLPRDMDVELNLLKDAVVALKKIESLGALDRVMQYLVSRFVARKK